MEERKIETLALGGDFLDDGEREYAVRADGVTIRFNPTDPLMIGRLYNVTKELTSKQEDYKRRANTINPESSELLDFLNEVNEDMLALLSGVFLHGMDRNIFGGYGAYSYNRNGIPLWVAFVSAVMDRMDVSVRTAQSEQTAKIDKLLSKYKRK